MISLGLLWFDDDPRRPVTRKIADALERYRDRVGYEPTVCQLHPQQEGALHVAVPTPRARRAPIEATVELPPTLKLEPDEHISPNYFMVGIAPGETPMLVPGFSEDDEYEGSATRQPQSARQMGKTGRASTTARTRTSARPRAKVSAKATEVAPPPLQVTTTASGTVQAPKRTASRAKSVPVESEPEVVAPAPTAEKTGRRTTRTTAKTPQVTGTAEQPRTDAVPSTVRSATPGTKARRAAPKAPEVEAQAARATTPTAPSHGANDDTKPTRTRKAPTAATVPAPQAAQQPPVAQGRALKALPANQSQGARKTNETQARTTRTRTTPASASAKARTTADEKNATKPRAEHADKVSNEQRHASARRSA